MNTLLSILGLVFWAGLCGLQLHTALSQRALIPLLLAVESALIAYRLLARRPAASADKSRIRQLAAWLSLFAPLALHGSGETWPGQILSSAGLLLTLWALVTLGPSFGVAPADRGLVQTGPYRFLRHPMYAGALLNAFGFLTGNLTPWNLAVFALIAGLAVVRIHWEEAVLTGYAPYSSIVAFRLIPGIW